MTTTSQSLALEVRPSRDFEGFLNQLHDGFDFTRKLTSSWSLEDWELAVDAGGGDDCWAASETFDCLALLKDLSAEAGFSGHGFWILFALAYLRGRAAFHSGLSSAMRPFRTEQLRDINIPNSMSVMIAAQFKLGYNDARQKSGEIPTAVPDWVVRALSLPLSRSRAERINSIQ